MVCLAGPPYLLYFGVKFYAPDPCKLQEELTRYVDNNLMILNMVIAVFILDCIFAQYKCFYQLLMQINHSQASV